VILQKAVLITGCSSGIGLDSARVLKSKGYRVIATARSDNDVQSLKSEGFEAIRLDITNYQEIDEVFAYIQKSDINLYALFNNAGYGQMGAVEDLGLSILKEQFETNFFAPFYLTQKAIKLFRKSGKGRVLQHSSVLGLVSLKYRGAYNASKYALEGLNDTLRLELKGTEIRIITINTGPVISKFRENAIKKFYENIDYKNSLYKDEYQKEIEGYKKRPLLLNSKSDVVINNIIHALESKNPKPRYYNTTSTYVLATLKRVLSTRFLDKMLVKI
jgi:short-subunit dehydrogenase